MTAIEVTQELKDKNPDFFKSDNIGNIVIKRLPNKFNGIENVAGGYTFRDDLQALDGWKEVISPSYNTSTQRLGSLVLDGENYTYEVIDLSEEEIKQRKLNQAEQERQLIVQIEQAKLAENKIQEIDTTEDILANETAFPLWVNFEDGFNFSLDFKVRDFNIENDLKVYKVIQAHNKQSDWNPISVPALFVLVQEEGATEWEVGAQYQIGDIRTYEGIEYICLQAHTSIVGWQPPNVPALWGLN